MTSSCLGSGSSCRLKNADLRAPPGSVFPAMSRLTVLTRGCEGGMPVVDPPAGQQISCCMGGEFGSWVSVAKVAKVSV